MRMVDVAEHADIGRMYPAVAAAAIEVGTPQIRNQGTVGGNLNQRPRCWYFRNEEFVCFKKGGNTCFSPAGENQFHAIFGGGPTLHRASVEPRGAVCRLRRDLPAARAERGAHWCRRPSTSRCRRCRTSSARTVLQPDELLTHVMLPAPGTIKSGHYEVRYKASHDWPIAFATVLLTMNGSSVQGARVVMGAVAPVPWRSQAAEQALAGKTITPEVATAAAEAALRGAMPLSQNAYKIQVAKTAVERAILRAAGLSIA